MGKSGAQDRKNICRSRSRSGYPLRGRYEGKNRLWKAQENQYSYSPQSLSDVTTTYGSRNLLQEFLVQNKFPEAIDALSQSLLLNRVTQKRIFEKARSEALAIAEQLFAEGRNAAGYARARFEEIYALHFLDAGPECARQKCKIYCQQLVVLDSNG